MKNIVVITGPTGVGKTDFVDKLANQDRFEIVNIDMGQFYEPLHIGTAKPNYKNTKYKQHLFDILKVPQNLTVTEYRTLVLRKINELWSNNIIPVLVGGSAFYIHSLLFPLQIDFKKSENSNIDFSAKSNDELWNQLSLIDSERASKININDRYRLERALTLWNQFAVQPSKLTPKLDLFADNIFIFVLTRDRENLYARINQRTEQMINGGWIEEVKGLDDKWKDFLKTKKIIGYNDIINFLELCINKKELVEIVQQKTRNYAKRQLAFFRKMTREIEQQNREESISIEWINLDNENYDLYIDQVLDKIFAKKR